MNETATTEFTEETEITRETDHSRPVSSFNAA